MDLFHPVTSKPGEATGVAAPGYFTDFYPEKLTRIIHKYCRVRADKLSTEAQQARPVSCPVKKHTITAGRIIVGEYNRPI
jgi:hypothetical protein